jgi:hypothetical protein
MDATKNFAVMQKTINTTARQVEQYEAAGMPIPKWLSKKIVAVDLCTRDWNKGVALMIDALQDEKSAIEKAQYVKYSPAR